MNRSHYRGRVTRLLAQCLLSTILLVGCKTQESRLAPELVRYGSMHETIGQKQHQGRVSLAELTSRPHFYGVGALEGLHGEITVMNSAAIVTGVAPDGRSQSLSAENAQATFLVGQSVDDWTSVTLGEAVSPERFDEMIANTAAGLGFDGATPFMFVVEGEFTDVRLHVINGACPIHARMKNVTLAANERPFELDTKRLAGTLVGVYAVDSVGKLTHPATRTHGHLVYEDRATGQRLTGHLERVGLAPGAVVKIPKSAKSGSPAPAR